jgi:Tfp pilus assembly protein PilX
VSPGRAAAPRAGFVLAELIVAMVIAALIGAALVQLVVSQSRFVSLQSSYMQARGGARAALNVLSSDFAMVTDSGLLAAAPGSVTVRVPYAFGVACTQSSGRTSVSLLPADSASYAQAAISGYAWQDSSARYVFVQPATVQPGVTTACTSASPPIATLSSPGSWPATVVQVGPNDVRTRQGAVVYLYQIVQYAFAPSAQLPGRLALWRTVLSTGARSELVAPFDSTSAFRFLVGRTLAVQATPPANLTTVYGLRLKLVAASEQPPEGRTAPVQFNLTSNVLFQNHP